jgi:hypothetical protein
MMPFSTETSILRPPCVYGGIKHASRQRPLVFYTFHITRRRSRQRVSGRGIYPEPSPHSCVCEWRNDTGDSADAHR